MAVTVALLMLMTSAMLYTNRSFVVEARTAINQTRHIQAFEAAEAGVEHMLAKLARGDQTEIASTSLAVAAGQSYAVTVTARPQGMLLINSVGCADGCAACSSACPAHARISQVAAPVSLIPNLPNATLTARQSVTATGGAELINTDVRWGGTAVRAGGSISVDGNVRIRHVPGSPPSTALIASDSTLASLQPTDMFRSMFGVDKETLRTFADVASSTANECSTVAGGGATRIIWIDGDCVLPSNAVIGSPSEPVVLIATGSLRLSGTATIHGLAYSGNADASNDLTTTGRGTIIGAAVTEGAAVVTGKVDLIYDRNLLSTLQSKLRIYARLPGGWKDFQ